MRLRSLRYLMIVAVMALAAVCAEAQETDTPQDPNTEEGSRGAFLSSRPPASSAGGGLSASGGSTNSTSSITPVTTSSKSTTPKSTTGKSTTGKTTTGRTSTGRTSTGRTSTGKSTGKNTTGTYAGNGSSVKSYAARPIGLGYSIYMRDPNGDAVRIDPTRTFRAGDRIRIALETNTDGYLYVFHTENDGPPTMIFPDSRLSGGKNWVDAHVPREIPSSMEVEPANRWFVFDNKPAVERLYIVISREPLAGLPTGDALVRLCGQNPGACPLKMSAGDWQQVKVSLEAKVVVSQMKVYGQAESSVERESVSRGLGLPQDAPAPTVVRMSAVSTDKTLVTAIDLIHN